MTLTIAPLANALQTEPLVRLRDNPLLVAQARRRMRRRQALPAFVVTAVLAACVLLSGVLGGTVVAWQTARALLFVGFVAILYGGGSTRVAGAVSEDRSSRLLDFHRATPTTAWTDTAGYLLGAPVREVVAAAIVLPFLVAACLMSGDAPLAVLAGLLVTLLCGALFWTCAAFTSLVAKRRFSNRFSPLVLLFLFFWAAPMAGASVAFVAHLTPLPAFIELGLVRGVEAQPLALFGVPLGHLAYSVVLQGTLGAFLVWASARKLGREGRHAFSRRGAVVFFVVLVLLVVGPAWSGMTGREAVAPAAAFFLIGALAVATALAVSLVPSRLGHVRAVRRSRRTGEALGWTAEEASAWPLAPLFAVLVIAGVFALGLGASARGSLQRQLLFAPEVALAFAAVAAFLTYAVGAWESVRLAPRTSGRGGVVLPLFVTLVVPLLVGWLTALSGAETVSTFAFAASPVYGVGGSAWMLGERWALEAEPSGNLVAVLVSLLATAAYASWFQRRAAGIRRAVAEDVAR